MYISNSKVLFFLPHRRVLRHPHNTTPQHHLLLNINPVALAATNARYEAEPTTANLKQVLYEGLQEVVVVFRGVEESFAEMIVMQL